MRTGSACYDALSQRMACCGFPWLPYFVGIVYHRTEEPSPAGDRLSETESTALPLKTNVANLTAVEDGRMTAVYHNQPSAAQTPVVRSDIFGGIVHRD